MRTGVEAAEQMKAWAAGKKSGVKGMCLKTCRLAYDIPAKHPSAIEAWKAAKTKHTDSVYAPIGAAHFWEIGKFGHIAIQSGELGKVWSTDAPKTDFIGKVSIGWFAQKWGAKYLGWTDSLNGKKLGLGKLPEIKP
jgi:hypothetical protein